MGKSGPRLSKSQLNQEFIVRSQKIWWREMLVALSTALVWLYSLSVIYFFLDALLSLRHGYPALLRLIYKMTGLEVKAFMKLVAVLFLSIYALLCGWSYYHRKKYDKLPRGTYPAATTKMDLLDLNILDEADYDALQAPKTITLKHNPIRVGSFENEES